MKLSKTKIQKLNETLKRSGLELAADKYSNEVNCFCLNANETNEENEAMRAVRSELRTAKVLTDITWLSYFE